MITKSSVDQSINVLNRKILELRKKRPKHRTLQHSLLFTRKNVAEWMEYCMDNKEENYEYNEETINSILDWIQRINGILKNLNEHMIDKSKIKKLVKMILKEVSQKDINSRHPQRRSFDSQWNPKLEMMTLDNLKSLRNKAARTLKSLKPEQDKFGQRVQASKDFVIYQNELKRRLQLINRPMSEDLGYSQNNVTNPRSNTCTRDELNDPRLNGKLNEDDEKTEHFWVEWNNTDLSPGTGKIFLNDEWFANALKLPEDYSRPGWYINAHKGAFKLNFKSPNKAFETIQSLLDFLESWYVSKTKLNEQYRFEDFTYLARGDGFGVPTTVYYGTIPLGVIVSQEDGYMIGTIKGPDKEVSFKQSPKNKFKTKEDAAKIIHQQWKLLRYNDSETKSW